MVREVSMPRLSSHALRNSPRASWMVRRLLAAKSAAAFAPRVEATPALVNIGKMVLENCSHRSVNKVAVSALARVVPPEEALPIVPPFALIHPVGAVVRAWNDIWPG